MSYNINSVGEFWGPEMFDVKSDNNADAGVEKSAVPEIPPSKRRQTYYIQEELIEKIRAYTYWKRMGISEMVNIALEDFFECLEAKKIQRQQSDVSSQSSCERLGKKHLKN